MLLRAVAVGHERRQTRTIGSRKPKAAGFSHARSLAQAIATQDSYVRDNPLALRARLDALLQRAEPASAADLDLLAAIRALKLPGASPYRGPIDPELLDRVLAERRFDVAGLAWLAGFGQFSAASAAGSRGPG